MVRRAIQTRCEFVVMCRNLIYEPLIIFFYCEVKMWCSKHGSVWRVAAAASDGAKTSASRARSSSSPLPVPEGEQQQQHYHRTTNPH